MVMSAAKSRCAGPDTARAHQGVRQRGLDPKPDGHGPGAGRARCLERAGWKPADLDLMEINEAFAAQACAVNQQMGWDTSKVNVNGGAIAIGHPIGASGAASWSRCCTKCSAAMRRKGSRRCASAAAWA
jgi:acetyl-CoA C-acetyltransferase